ncbi:hypothetical protein EPR50_G00243920 [Perca flavescens]|uniref:Coagulation factor VII n=1 Tax=Perca flavescens TaxID=8167 RepID=A0A484BXS2_PERFV|nr:hypothetical protein EPR50_G00243920 [Perca flavescens]
MWLRVFFTLFVFSVSGSQAASVFLDPDVAHRVLVRAQRSNSGWLEELQKGDLKRECLEERCSFEEAREVFEHTERTLHLRTVCVVVPVVPDSCKSSPCLNGGSCSPQGGSYTCYCPPQFNGLNCENEVIVCGMVPVLHGQKKSDSRGRIVGGTECPRGECPWQVLLVYKDKGFCGGVIYTPTWIITASHCLEDTEARFLKVVAGEHNTQLAEGSEQWIQVSQIIVHENYVKRTADNDIGLLRLAAPIVYTPYAVPACLPTRPLAERVLWAVAKHTVSGWGRRSENGPTSTVLRRLAVPRIRTQVCVEESGVEITDNMFCAGYIEGLQDSCKGDSGGPLVTLYGKTVFLLGIVSWGKGCARPGAYGIYTRVSNYLPWIHNRTAPPKGLPNRTPLPTCD